VQSIMHGSAPDFPSERDRLLALRIVLIVRRRPITFTPSSAHSPGRAWCRSAPGRSGPRRQRQQAAGRNVLQADRLPEVDEGAGDGQRHRHLHRLHQILVTSRVVHVIHRGAETRKPAGSPRLLRPDVRKRGRPPHHRGAETRKPAGSPRLSRRMAAGGPPVRKRGCPPHRQGAETRKPAGSPELPRRMAAGGRPEHRDEVMRGTLVREAVAMGGYVFCCFWGFLFLCFVSASVFRSCVSVVSGVFCFCVFSLVRFLRLFFLLFLGVSFSVSFVLCFW